jgi:hypothetical protein
MLTADFRERLEVHSIGQGKMIASRSALVIEEDGEDPSYVWGDDKDHALASAEYREKVRLMEFEELMEECRTVRVQPQHVLVYRFFLSE